MKKLMMMVMMVVMMASMSLTAYAGESKNNFKKVDRFYADEIVYDLPHAELSSGMEFITRIDDDNYVIGCDDDGTITIKKYCNGRIEYATLDVYVDGNTMVLFYDLDGNEYAETINGSAYAEEMYNRS